MISLPMNFSAEIETEWDENYRVRERMFIELKLNGWVIDKWRIDIDEEPIDAEDMNGLVTSRFRELFKLLGGQND